MALLSDDAAFYAWAAATWVLAASVAVAIARGWARGRGLRVEDITTGFRAPLMLVGALLSQISLRLYTVHVTMPESRRRRGGGEAVGMEAAVERFLSDEAYVWPVGSCMLGLAVLLIFVAGARRRTPPPRVDEQRAGGFSVLEIVLFLVCVWASVCSFPVTVRDYMLATGCSNIACDRPSFSSRTYQLE